MDGTKLRGTADGGAIVGEIDGRSIAFATPDDFQSWKAGTIGSASAPTMYQGISRASLKDDGTLAGRSDVYVRGEDFVKFWTWTAVRKQTR